MHPAGKLEIIRTFRTFVSNWTFSINDILYHKYIKLLLAVLVDIYIANSRITVVPALQPPSINMPLHPHLILK